MKIERPHLGYSDDAAFGTGMDEPLSRADDAGGAARPQPKHFPAELLRFFDVPASTPAEPANTNRSKYFWKS